MLLLRGRSLSIVYGTGSPSVLCVSSPVLLRSPRVSPPLRLALLVGAVGCVGRGVGRLVMVAGGWYGMNCELSLIHVAILAGRSEC